MAFRIEDLPAPVALKHHLRKGGRKQVMNIPPQTAINVVGDVWLSRLF
jgi:hypothetical protein